MSWTDYTAHLRASNVTDAAAIISVEDGSLVAGDNFQVSQHYYIPHNTSSQQSRLSLSLTLSQYA